MPDVVLLEDAADLRFLFTQIVERKLALECLCLESFAQLQANAATVLRAKLIFLDMNLGYGDPGGLDAYNWLCKNAFPGSIYFLTGHATDHPHLQAAQQAHARILEKPFRSAELIRIIQRDINRQAEKAGSCRQGAPPMDGRT